MPAISKSWVTIADSAVDPDSPLDAALMTGLRDNDVHLREWLGAGFTAGAVQDHNHDGSNSAAIDIGPNWLRNGGFSNGTSGWTGTAYTGGTVTTGSSNETEGTAGAVITSTVAANGGGKLESNEFIPVVAGQTRQFMLSIKASGATVPVKAEVLWYDDAQASISNSTIVSVTTTSPTTDRLVIRRIAAPSTAKFCKVRLELPTGAGGTGTVYFDSAIVTTPQMMGGMQVFTSTGTFGDAVDEVWGDVYVEVVGAGGNGGASSATNSYASGGGGGGGGGYSAGWITNNSAATVTVGATAGATSSFAATGGTLSATGGSVGTAGTAGADNSNTTGGGGGAGGVGSGGSINIGGQGGAAGGIGIMAFGGGIIENGTGGSGGSSVLGGGAVSLALTSAGAAGRAYGGGGGGAYRHATGGSFAAGVVIVRW